MAIKLRSRRSYRKKSMYKRKYTRRMKRTGGTNAPPVSFKRTVWMHNWQFGAAATTNFWRYYNVNMDNLSNLAEYQALFDQYKVNGVKLQFRPKWDGADAGPSGSSGQNMVYATIFKDPLSILTPTGTYSTATLNTFLENANGKITTRQCNKPFSVYYKPFTPSADIASNGRFLKTPWLSLANATSALQRGFHVFLNDSNFSANSTLSFDVILTLYFQCRGNK